ncbi:MAG: hypothetical protein HY360_24200 [Verrucomicrobia bacterium]|nr:hypothetical protein [Verrucomicrobiota bacterium]
MNLVMVIIGSASLSRNLQTPLLLLGMLLMAWIIAFRFMALADENVGLTVTIIGCTLFAGGTLFLLIAFDGVRTFALSLH